MGWNGLRGRIGTVTVDDAPTPRPSRKAVGNRSAGPMARSEKDTTILIGKAKML